jgi:serine/threonine protein kinase
MVVLHERGTLDHIRQNRSADPSFHANLGSIGVWCTPSRPPWSARRALLVQEIKAMLAKDPAMRPTAKQILVRVTGYDVAEMVTSKHSIFGSCCKSLFISVEQRRQDILVSKTKTEQLQLDLRRSNTRLKEQERDLLSLIQQRKAADAQLAAQKASCYYSENIGPR